jgi:hypothetical protein
MTDRTTSSDSYLGVARSNRAGVANKLALYEIDVVTG